MERNRTQLRGAALLMLTALIWGTAFVAQSVGMDHLGPCAFTAVRNYIGCVALLPVIAFASRLRKGKPEDDGEQVPPAKARKRLALWGAACGLLPVIPYQTFADSTVHIAHAGRLRCLHDTVLEGQTADFSRCEQMGKELGHKGIPPY